MAPSDRPWFLWDVDISDREFRERLGHPDPSIRAQWQGALLREARVFEVWRYLTVEDVLENWSNIRRHFGRHRPFGDRAVEDWRRHGLAAS